MDAMGNTNRCPECICNKVALCPCWLGCGGQTHAQVRRPLRAPARFVTRPTGLPLPPQVPVLSALPVPALTGVPVSCSAANCPGGCSNNRPSDGAPLAGSAQHTTAMSPWWSGYCVCVTLQALQLQPWRGWVIRGALAVCRNRGLGGSLSFI